MKRRATVLIAVILAMALLMTCGLSGCSQSSPEQDQTQPSADQTDQQEKQTGEKVVIGLSMGTLQEERWQRERDFFVAKAESLGAEVLVQSANADENLQVSQCENLITQGIDILVVMPHNGDACGPIVESAHEADVPVIAYNRMINNAPVDFFITFDDFYVGVYQAEYALEHAEKGNWIMIGGSPTDPNAKLIRDGQMSVLQPYIDSGEIKVVVDQSPMGWNPDLALEWIEDGFAANDDNIQCVLTSNDGCAGAAVQVLTERNLAGKIVVTGLDTDLSACQRIVEGTQSMTVYKRLQVMAETCAEIAVAMALGEEIPYETETTNNGSSDIQCIKLHDEEDMFVVTKDNMNLVIEDNWLTKEDIYKNIPKEQWPSD